jgi:ribosome-associated protein
MSESYLVIELNHQPVELCKLLKIANLVGGGGEAKIVISEGYVSLNGEVEYQKRKKVYHEDVIEFNGEIVQLLINESLPQQPSELTAQDSFQHTDKSDTIKQSLEHEQEKETEYKKTTVPKKRRPIAF